jgi:hypothetical protein
MMKLFGPRKNDGGMRNSQTKKPLSSFGSARRRPWATSEPSLLAIVLNQPRELLSGIPPHLLQVAADEALVRLRESPVLQLHQAHLNSLITVSLGTEHRKGDELGSRQEVFQLRKGRQRMEIHEGVHPSIMPET